MVVTCVELDILRMRVFVSLLINTMYLVQV